MSTGATPEQIEAAKQWTKDYEDTAVAIIRCVAAEAVRTTIKPDRRIIRADENHLTPETKSALTNILRFVDGIFIVGGGHEQIQRDWDVLSSAIGGQT